MSLLLPQNPQLLHTSPFLCETTTLLQAFQLSLRHCGMTTGCCKQKHICKINESYGGGGRLIFTPFRQHIELLKVTEGGSRLIVGSVSSAVCLCVCV